MPKASWQKKIGLAPNDGWQKKLDSKSTKAKKTAKSTKAHAPAKEKNVSMVMNSRAAEGDWARPQV